MALVGGALSWQEDVELVPCKTAAEVSLIRTGRLVLIKRRAGLHVVREFPPTPDSHDREEKKRKL